MTIENIYQETEFNVWILAQTPDYIIDVLSADKADFNSISMKNKKQKKINNTLRKKKILSIAKNKKRIFDVQKMLAPCAIFDWAILEEEPEKLTNINEVIMQLYTENKVADRQQLATQLYFVRAFEEAYEIYLESKNAIDEPVPFVTKSPETEHVVSTPTPSDKQLKKLSKEIEKKKEELSTLRTKVNAEIKQLKEALNSKKTELFDIKNIQKEQQEELKVYKAKYQEELDQRLAKEAKVNKAHFLALDKKDTQIQELANELSKLKKQQETQVKPLEATSNSIPLIDTGIETTSVDASLISKLATTWKNKPDQEEGYSVVQQEEPVFNTPIKRSSTKEKLKVVILGNPRNSTVLNAHSYEMIVFENEQCEQFIQAAQDSQLVYLYEPRYLPEEFERLATAAVKNKSIVIHSFADLKQTLGAL